MDDLTYLRAFEECTLDNFTHRDHIRVAWTYLRLSESEAEAGARMAASIRRFADHHGAAQKYHETMTVAWMRLVAAAARETPLPDFDQFALRHPDLLNSKALDRFYSPALLTSDTARQSWVEPDMQPLPE